MTTAANEVEFANQVHSSAPVLEATGQHLEEGMAPCQYRTCG
jgi:hypothetical protein